MVEESTAARGQIGVRKQLLELEKVNWGLPASVNQLSMKCLEKSEWRRNKTIKESDCKVITKDKVRYLCSLHLYCVGKHEIRLKRNYVSCSFFNSKNVY